MLSPGGEVDGIMLTLLSSRRCSLLLGAILIGRVSDTRDDPPPVEEEALVFVKVPPILLNQEP